MWYEVARDVEGPRADRRGSEIDWLERVVRCADSWRARGSDDDARKETRSAMLRATRAVDDGFSFVRVPDRDEAARIWRAVVAGEWALLDHFDVDGRRFVVARSTPAKPTRFDALTPCERRVVAYAARGYTNKLIAYELNVSPSAVGMRIARAVRKLAVKSRVELIAAYRRTHALTHRAP